MKVFPGSFPLPVFDALDLDDLTDALTLATEMMEMELAAIQANQEK